MKYIRTKDGRILKGSNYGFGVGMPYKNYDVKVADTIEELCDEFVIYDADIKRCHILDKGFYHRFDKESKKALHIANRYIYGAIWTEWGLKYVAKMNERGELELL